MNVIPAQVDRRAAQEALYNAQAALIDELNTALKNPNAYETHHVIATAAIKCSPDFNFPEGYVEGIIHQTMRARKWKHLSALLYNPQIYMQFVKIIKPLVNPSLPSEPLRNALIADILKDIKINRLADSLLEAGIASKYLNPTILTDEERSLLTARYEDQCVLGNEAITKTWWPIYLHSLTPEQHVALMQSEVKNPKSFILNSILMIRPDIPIINKFLKEQPPESITALATRAITQGQAYLLNALIQAGLLDASTCQELHQSNTIELGTTLTRAIEQGQISLFYWLLCRWQMPADLNLPPPTLHAFFNHAVSRQAWTVVKILIQTGTINKDTIITQTGFSLNQDRPQLQLQFLANLVIASFVINYPHQEEQPLSLASDDLRRMALEQIDQLTPEEQKEFNKQSQLACASIVKNRNTGLLNQLLGMGPYFHKPFQAILSKEPADMLTQLHTRATEEGYTSITDFFAAISQKSVT